MPMLPVPVGGDESCIDERWAVDDILVMLGYRVASNAGIYREWRVVRARLWGVFWKNCAGSRAGRLGFEEKVNLLLRAALGTMLWVCSRWPFQKKVAIEVDKLQVHMIAILSGIRRLPGEISVEWYRRRGRAAKVVAGKIRFSLKYRPKELSIGMTMLPGVPRITILGY